jgi:cyclopropane-fatty-acyl-phospholipid synthase
VEQDQEVRVFEKQICRALFSRIKTGGLTVTYWDGQTERYGPEPWVGIGLRSRSAVWAICRNVHLGVGEGYMDGKVAIDGDPAELGRLSAANRDISRWARKLHRMTFRGRDSKARQAANVRHHYDLGNDFYRLWLDRSMTYSCAYFRRESDSLEQAQAQKVSHILRKLDLSPGTSLLDIGSGWGELITAAARDHGVRAHGITLSREQLEHTRRRIDREGLTGTVTVELCHYEDLPRDARFDRVVSVGMYEHVGAGNHTAYMAAVDRVLREGGTSLLHTITQRTDRPTNAWIDRYIFPGGHLPTLGGIVGLLPDHDFHAIDYESLRRHYARTLQEWSRRFEASIDRVREMYDERFVRMWRLYLRGSFAGFAYGELDLAQVLWTKGLSDAPPMTREYMYREPELVGRLVGEPGPVREPVGEPVATLRPQAPARLRRAG